MIILFPFGGKYLVINDCCHLNTTSMNDEFLRNWDKWKCWR